MWGTLLQDLWSLREHVPLALMSLSRTGTASSPGTGLVKKLFKYDVSLPEVAQMPVLVSEVADQLRREGYRVTQFAGDDDNGSTSVAVTFQLFGFGHIGDGNLHLNILMT
jgi:FAD/FMN-containing dehydrogenase